MILPRGDRAPPGSTTRRARHLPPGKYLRKKFISPGNVHIAQGQDPDDNRCRIWMSPAGKGHRTRRSGHVFAPGDAGRGSRPGRNRKGAFHAPVHLTKTRDRPFPAPFRDPGQPGVPGEKGSDRSLRRQYIQQTARNSGGRPILFRTLKKNISGDAGGIGVRRYGAAIPGGRVTDPVEYVLFRVYEPHTVRGESERSWSTIGATKPAGPAHI